jgi:hypothetical protein|tara:strand:- start:1256 stop:2821 length:1566 start_codon:yes stop_codon:yes gene_type:complete
MKIIELLIDEEQLMSGIEAISIVDRPAIEENFIALSKQEQIKLAEVDNDKRILIGPALIPNKNILRSNGDEEYYIYFSEDTVRQASQLFLMRGNQNKSTLEHQAQLHGLSVVESWIIDDANMDKSKKYGFDLPTGTWMVTMKVNNDAVWNEYVKTGLVKGFSIEGYFTDKIDMSKLNSVDDEEEAKEILLEIANSILDNKYELKTYGDYGSGVRNNAKRGIELNKKVNNKCATSVGKVRAQQLARGEKLSVSTIKRMYSYLSRAETYYDPNDSKACGTISYLLWGGKSGLAWSRGKLKELGELKLSSMVIDKDFAIIDDRLAYSSKEKAEKMAKNIGCKGHHVHEYEGKSWFMPCEKHIQDEELVYGKCPEGFKKVYGKCVKLAEVGPRGGIRKSPKAPASGTPNKNPKGKGTAKGDASGKRGAKVSAKDRASLQKKADDFNKRYKEKLGYGITVGMLASVFQRGLGAFNTSHSPNVKSPSQWAHARVNAFMYLVRNGRPQNAKYTTDYDLLPAKHPKSKK